MIQAKTVTAAVPPLGELGKKCGTPYNAQSLEITAALFPFNRQRPTFSMATAPDFERSGLCVARAGE